MSKYRDLSSGDVFPAYWTDAIQEFTGTIVAGLRLTTPSANTVRAFAGTGSDQVAVGVSGLYRYRSTNAEVTISGASGTYNLYAAVSDNDIAGVTDTTDYNWYLFYGTTAPTGTISGGGTIFATRKVGEVDWDNTASAITGLRQTVGSGDSTQPVTPTASRTSVTPLSVRGVTSQSAPLVSVGSASSATDRLTVSAAGQVAIPVTGSTGGLLIGGDATLYRSASNTLRTGGNVVADATITGNALVSTSSVTSATVTTTGAITAGTSLAGASASITNNISAATLSTSGNATVGGSATATAVVLTQNNKTAITLSSSDAGLTIGSDTNLYRSDANTLKTDDSLVVAADAQFGSSSSALGFYGATPAAQSTGWSVSNVSTNKSFDADATTVNELADVLGTLITTLKTNGLLG